MKKIILGITGASGAIYAKRFIEHTHQVCELHVIYSRTAPVVFSEELDLDISQFLSSFPDVKIHERSNFLSPVASGSNPFDAYIVMPCSMKTLGQIRAGVGENLITRVGDIALKERRPLILVPREAPLSSVHLENMLRISDLGGMIVPASPGFYHRPESLIDLVDFIIERVARLAQINLGIVKPWKSED